MVMKGASRMNYDHNDNWEALFDKKYLRWFHLNGEPALLEIVKVEKDVELVMAGGVKKKAPLVHFKQVQGKIDTVRPQRADKRRNEPEIAGNVKPMIMNKTNLGMIAKIHGPKPSLWVGKQVVLYQTTTREYYECMRNREDGPCIGIRESKRKQNTPQTAPPVATANEGITGNTKETATEGETTDGATDSQSVDVEDGGRREALDVLVAAVRDDLKSIPTFDDETRLLALSQAQSDLETGNVPKDHPIWSELREAAAPKETFQLEG